MDEPRGHPTEIEMQAEETYSAIRGCVVTAQSKIAAAVNTAMVLAYHEIGKQIYKACGENERAGYGKRLLQYLSERLTAEFGKGFTTRNLQMMRKFYLLFPNTNTLCAELSWSHYRRLYTLPEDNQQIYASKYFTYLPTEEELRCELRLDGFTKSEND